MLVRGGDGRWCQLVQVEAGTERGCGELCGDDIAPVFGASGALPVAATRPVIAGNPEVICLDRVGGISVVLSFFDEPVDGALMRILECAGALQSLESDEFHALCDRANDGGSLGTWVREVVGSGDADAIDAGIVETRSAGRFDFYAVTGIDGGLERLAAPLAYLNTTSSAHVRCFEVASYAAGDIVGVEMIELGVSVAHGAVPGTEPTLAPRVTAVPSPPPAVQLPTGGLDDLIAAIKSSGGEHGEKHAALASTLAHHVDVAFADVSWLHDGDDVVLQAWIDSNAERVVLFELDGNGVVTVLLDALDPARRELLLGGIARILPDDLPEGSRQSQRMQMSIAVDLSDDSLLELFLATLDDVIAAENGDVTIEREGGVDQDGDDSTGLAGDVSPGGLVALGEFDDFAVSAELELQSSSMPRTSDGRIRVPLTPLHPAGGGESEQPRSRMRLTPLKR